MDKLLEEIGPLFMVGIPGPQLDRATVALHRKLPFGGVVLFGRNWRDHRALRKLTSQVHALRGDDPPLIAIDHEGGRVCRLGDPFTRFPPPAEMAKRGEAAVARAARTMARELLEGGIDVDFAPLLDTNTNPQNPVIGERSFGGKPKLVARMGSLFFRAMWREGIIPCGKHFPGHGDTCQDSHLTLPQVTRTRASLLRREIVPFKAAIQAGIPMLMTAHVLYSSLDCRLPATLSPAIMTDLLRRQLGFAGVICSDDLEMRAISRRHRPAQIAIMAVTAGLDMLLFCQSQEKALAAAEALARAVRSGEIPRDRIEQSLERLSRCRRRSRRLAAR